jgi:hypothetical protein
MRRGREGGRGRKRNSPRGGNDSDRCNLSEGIEGIGEIFGGDIRVYASHPKGRDGLIRRSSELRSLREMR